MRERLTEIRERLAKRQKPLMATCMSCRHQQVAPRANQPYPCPSCEQCGKGAFAFIETRGAPSHDADVSYLLELVETLRSALVTYGQHKTHCAARSGAGFAGWCPCHGERANGAEPNCPNKVGCTCGFTSALHAFEIPTADAPRAASSPQEETR